MINSLRFLKYEYYISQKEISKICNEILVLSSFLEGDYNGKNK